MPPLWLSSYGAKQGSLPIEDLEVGAVAETLLAFTQRVMPG